MNSIAGNERSKPIITSNSIARCRSSPSHADQACLSAASALEPQNDHHARSPAWNSFRRKRLRSASLLITASKNDQEEIWTSKRFRRLASEPAPATRQLTPKSRRRVLFGRFSSTNHVSDRRRAVSRFWQTPSANWRAVIAKMRVFPGEFAALRQLQLAGGGGRATKSGQ